MKLKVVLCKYEEWIDVDTIDTLKASIMSRFYLTAGELSSRHLLVRDNRNLIGYPPIITGCFNLLDLKDDGSTTLKDCCEDGDTLVLGLKGPCVVRLVTDFVFEEGHNIEFDDSFTLGQFKQKIHDLTGKPVTKKNLPEVLYNGDDWRPLLYFGFYRIRPILSDEDSDFQIFPDSNNRPVSKYPVSRMVKYDDKGNEFVSYYKETRPAKSKAEVDKFLATMKRKIQLHEMKIIENRKKKEEKMMKKKKKNNDNDNENDNNNNNNKEAKLLTDLS